VRRDARHSNITAASVGAGAGGLVGSSRFNSSRFKSSRFMVLVIDNYDSFTYNLVQYLGELGAEVRVMRNDTVTLEDVVAANADRIVISPGPGRPEQAGVTMSVIRHLGQTTPVCGVCLGHQAIGMVFGGQVVRAAVPMHGKTSMIEHDGRALFNGITGPFVAS